MIKERSFIDFVWMNAVPSVGLVVYTVYSQITGAGQPWHLVVIYFGLLISQYVIRQGLVRKNSLKILNDSIQSFETIVDRFRSTCQTFDQNPLLLFPKCIGDDCDLIKGWLDLLKRVIQSRRNDATYAQIARWAREFIRIACQYRKKVVQAFLDRANTVMIVTKGTKKAFAEFKLNYNEMADKINPLVEEMGFQKLEKIADEIQVQELQQ